MSLFVEEDDDKGEYNVLGNENSLVEENRNDEERQLFIDEIGDTAAEYIHRPPSERPEIPVTFEEQDSVPVYQSREVSCNLPLRYQQEIVEDMLAKDGLLLLGRGLGWDIITANILHAISSPLVTLEHGNTKSEKKGLIFVLNAKEDEILRLQEELTELCWIDDFSEENTLVTVGGDNQTTVNKRKEIYQNGGILSVTSRVLVVDMLSGVINPTDITGIFILHAEKIRETSNESFIVNLYRDKNDWGFIKAVSDEPELFTGFTPLASKLKYLALSDVFLWPRFHVEVSGSLHQAVKPLQRNTKEVENRRFVTEINTKLSYKMNKIQSALLSCIQACLLELRRHNGELADEYWDMENVHDPDFVLRIRLSVESQWHRLTYTTKQLIYDLGTLTDLLKKLVTVDSITFYEILQGIIDQNIKHSGAGILNMSMSPWLNLDESNTIISYSRERALGKMKIEKRIGTSEEYSISEEYILEELPKWHQLGMLLDDIMHEKATRGAKDTGPILIMCSSKQIVNQLGQILCDIKKETNTITGNVRYNSRKFMVRKLNEYLLWSEVNSLAKKINVDINSKEEEKQPEDEQKISISKSFSRNGMPISKRRRTRGGASAARVGSLYSGSSVVQNSEAVVVDENIMEDIRNEVKQESKSVDILEYFDDIIQGGFVDRKDDDLGPQKFDFNALNFCHIDKDDQIIIQYFDERMNDALLQELSPSYIIMYEPNLAFIRRIEVYQAVHKESPAKTYFMYYGTSVEEQKHLIRIKKEKEAFTRLIREKATLGKRFDSAEDKARLRVRVSNVLNTRVAGGANFKSDTDELRVVVDVREFRSSLPNLLYRIGIKVIPCMITVGDYIISPKICVERKAIPDLISSFKSGRLFHQCEQMFRHYEYPTLLIEFDESKSFSLDPFTESKFQRVNPKNPTSNQMSQQNIQANLLSLLIAFPKLKIIWSSSPYETAQIFLKLKSNQDEPDVGDALDKGVNRAMVTNDGGPPVFNEDPIDFIQTIPGINNTNYYLLIQRVKNIEQLAKLLKEELMGILGEENGRKVFNFFNHSVS